MHKKLICLMFAVAPVFVAAQGWLSNPFSVSLINNATMLPPRSLAAPVTQPLHPGFNVGYEFGYTQDKNGKWFQSVNAGYYYQRYAYQAILLYTQAGYRRFLGNFTLDGSLQAGYMHLLLLTDRLVLQDDGGYVNKKGYGKPQFAAGAGIGAGYNFGSSRMLRRLFLNYDIRLQMPFVKSYTPVLPNGIVSLGMQFNIESTRYW